MKKINIVKGIDLGHSLTITENHTFHSSIKTGFKKGLLGNDNNVIYPVYKLFISEEGRDYTIGSVDGIYFPEQGRYLTQAYFRVLLTSIALEVIADCEKEIKEKNLTEFDVNAKIVLGMPIQYFTRENNVSNIINVLKGKEENIIVEGIQFKIKIEDIKFHIEGDLPHFPKINKETNKKDYPYKKGRYLNFDIGGGTCEIVEFIDGSPTGNYTTFTRGINNIKSNILSNFNREYGTNIMDKEFIFQALTDNIKNNLGKSENGKINEVYVNIANNNIDISSYKNEFIQYVDEIYSYAINFGFDTSINEIVFTAGGSIPLQEAIRELMLSHNKKYFIVADANINQKIFSGVAEAIYK